jgi:acetyl-CoA carboxylase carboxyl transferase subunit alpha
MSILTIDETIRKIDELTYAGTEFSFEIDSLSAKLEELRKAISHDLSRWERFQIARHPQRPKSLDYIERMFDDFIELHGDRSFREDAAIIGGIAAFQGIPVVVIAQQQGRDSKEKRMRNFGMAHPEGYRKARRLMLLAEKFRKPVITLIDTQGAYPGVGAEERGIGEAIARNLLTMSQLKVPIIAVIIGEGGSGGALAIAMGDMVLMLENAVYSVITPEGCAAILWRDSARAKEACEALKLTAGDLLDFGVIDQVVKEPPGGAHYDYEATAENLKAELKACLRELMNQQPEDLLARRYDKYRRMGVYHEG